MKRLLPLLLLFLTACGIHVDDLGDAWNRGTVDHALEGKWLVELKPGKPPEIAAISNVGGMLRLDGRKDNGEQETDWYKTIQIGNYHFLMSGPRSTYYVSSGHHPGDLVRYTARSGELWLYSLNAKALEAFLKQKYPTQDKFLIHFCNSKKEWCIADTITVAKLDNETLNIISKIPNDDEYWEAAGPFNRISH